MEIRRLQRTHALELHEGDGVGAGSVAGVGSGMGVASANTHTIFAELFNSLANQDAPARSYADTITVEVAY